MRFRGLFFTAGLALATAGLSNAASIVQSFSLPSGSITTTWTGSSTINQFDTSLGTLENITILSTMDSVASAGATDITGNSAGDSYTISASTSLSLSDPWSNLLVAPTNSISSTYLNQSNGSIMSVSTSGTVNSTAIWAIDTNTVNDPYYLVCLLNSEGPGCLASSAGAGSPSNPLAYTNWLGTGTLALTANAQTTGSFGGSSFGSAFATGSASVNVSVIYNYTEAGPPPSTPEPATMALFGGGLIAVGLLSRRRFRKS